MTTKTKTTTTPVSLAKDTDAPVTFGEESQTDRLITLLASYVSEAYGKTEPKVFSSGNTGVYVSVRLKAPEARALGIVVPIGGKVSFTLQALVIDPANSKDA